MKVSLVRGLLMCLFLCAFSSVAWAQASRTWVSGVGDDANPCSRTAPCKTFAGAISKTAPGGEIDALDPAGFGALTITKAITIDGGGGQVASVLVAGTNGIVVQAGANDVVILRNLRFNGLNGTANPGINGIRFLAGKALIVESCDIFGFSQNGIDVSVNQGTGASVSILNTTLSNNSRVGVRMTNAVANVYVRGTLSHVTIHGGTNGVEAANSAAIDVTFSDISFFSGSGLAVTSTATSGAINAESSMLHNGVTGANVNASATGGIIRLSNSDLFDNTGGSTNGTISSAGNNRRGGNIGIFGSASGIAVF